jgi:hypothetical protein
MRFNLVFKGLNTQHVSTLLHINQDSPLLYHLNDQVGIKILIHGLGKTFVLFEYTKIKLSNKWHFVVNKTDYAICLKMQYISLFLKYIKLISRGVFTCVHVWSKEYWCILALQSIWAQIFKINHYRLHTYPVNSLTQCCNSMVFL